jgi:alkylation response protein AidB-like acyl-CoA dehydrogenase
MQVTNAALGVGVAKAAFEYSRDYAKEREAFGVKIAQKQAIAFTLAEMATEIESSRLLTWEAAWKLDGQRGVSSRHTWRTAADGDDGHRQGGPDPGGTATSATIPWRLDAQRARFATFTGWRSCGRRGKMTIEFDRNRSRTRVLSFRPSRRT